ncbi:type II secretion system F family protein [Actinokineospora xionganensis]|uniref:Type II secretion system F family protein n=1 Tax=Actinokineospora xionganensis TaxID=2684470 RepID=A0ABR7LF66_9PSEU|nr:type II secretion system F family protein [Actinokineospora xionganensis]MBC6451364.1 type II secretion system F family protein [Actinokineospora xionganensis]
MTTLAVLAGGGFAGAVILLVVAIRGTQPRPAHPASTWTVLRARVGRWRAGTVVTAVATGLLVLAVTGWPVAALGAAVAVVAVPPLWRQDEAQRVIARLEGLAEWTRRLVDILKSGAGGLEQAVAMSVRTAPAAIDTEVATLAARARVRGLEPALRMFADDLGDEASDRVAASLILRARAGGKGLVEVLENLADTLREDVAARQQVEADRAKPRTTTRAIMVFTLIVIAGLFAFARTYLAPFGTAAGQVALAVIGVVVATSFIWMRSLARPQTGHRFLRDGDRR